MKLTLRPYQSQSVYLLDRALNANSHPLCVLPTGAGKSLVMAALLQLRDQKALVLAHVSEVLEQNAKALKAVAPSITQSFFVARLGEKKLGTQVVFGSVQSVYRSLDKFRAARPLVIVDEAHLAPRKSEAMYARVFDHFRGAHRIGFTATPMRLDSGSLVEGNDAWFDTIAHEVSPKTLIEQGYLVPLSGVITEQQADLNDVAVRGGEFVLEQAQAAVVRTLALHEVVAQALQLARRRKSWLVFAAGIEHAEQVEAEMRKQGVFAETVTSETDDEVRAKHIEDFRSKSLRALINVGVFTVGFDAPTVDCIISLRPTKSPVLWQQMLGRGMRLAQNKNDCLLLDFVGNLERLGGAGCLSEVSDLRNASLLPGKTAKKTKHQILIQRQDPAFFDASHRDPMLSGDLFEARVVNLDFHPIASKRQPGKRMLLATYSLEDEFGRALVANTFVCVEYAGAARYHAVEWFMRRGVAADKVPYDAIGALVLARALPKPTEVKARFDARMRRLLVERERIERGEPG